MSRRTGRIHYLPSRCDLKALLGIMLVNIPGKVLDSRLFGPQDRNPQLPV